MQLDIHQFAKLAAIFASEEDKSPAKKIKSRDPIKYNAAYPDYRKSLVSQKKQDPTVSGISRGLTTGALGSILGAVIARSATDRPELVAGGAGLGALLGAVPGYISGREEAKSDYTRLLALRRLGINTPGELEVIQKHPQVTSKLLSEGFKL